MTNSLLLRIIEIAGASATYTGMHTRSKTDLQTR